MIAAPLLCLAAVAHADGRADAVADRLAAAVDTYDADRAAARAAGVVPDWQGGWHSSVGR